MTGEADGSQVMVSIVTICLNSESLIERTIRSVIEQTHEAIEYIIIDGGSSDGTLGVVDRHREHIDMVISERDDGIYDAMNKGILHARGDVLYFLNSGDMFFDSRVIEKVARAFSSNPEYDLVEGDIIFYDEAKKEYRSTKRTSIMGYVQRGINHQAVFARRGAFEKTGRFDTEFDIYGDLDWFLNCIIGHGMKILHLDIPISYYLRGGLSETNRTRRFFEKSEIYDRYCNFARIREFGGRDVPATIVVLMMRTYYLLMKTMIAETVK